MQASKNKTASSRRGKRSAGFTLIELLIVVAVIMVIAGIAIPNFIRSKMRANEAGAVANLRTITTASVVYNTTYGVGFAPSLAALGGDPAAPSATQAGLIDSVLSTGVKSGYIFTYKVLATDAAGNTQAYSVNADPITPGTTGDRHFYTDQTNVIRVNLTAAAGLSDSPIQ
ncbi:MAG: pili assembly chaperone [Acidobacteria bacterium]|nr:MAG: pili assembly chaperone [Acidobacteriota bacterium]